MTIGLRFAGKFDGLSEKDIRTHNLLSGTLPVERYYEKDGGCMVPDTFPGTSIICQPQDDEFVKSELSQRGIQYTFSPYDPAVPDPKRAFGRETPRF